MSPAVTVVVGAFGISALHAQLNLLTVREAESLVERIPAVAEAKRQGQCPQSSPNFGEPGHVWFQVRSNCGASGGMLIDNYDVNQRTGDVTLWGDDPQPVADVAGKQLAHRLVRQAQRRLLSAEEARCLAYEAARSLPGWNSNDSHIAVKPFGKTDGETMRFTSEHSSPTRPGTSWRMLTVNLATARVRDDQVGMDLMSERLGSLTSKITDLRNPFLLSDEDAISVTALIPAIATRLRDGCKLYTGGAFRSNEALVGLTCTGLNNEGTTIALNLETGAASDADTGKIMESPEGARLARQLLGGIQQRRSELQAEISAACRQQ